jgi:hypothetical protein
LSASRPQCVRTMSAMCPHVSASWAHCIGRGAWWTVFAEDGILHGYTAEALDAEVDIEGWAEQLQQVGWLIIESQQLAIPEFESHFSQSTKRRMRDAKRKRTSRNSCPQNVRTAADKKRTTEQKRTEEKNNKTPLPPLPKKLDTPAFQQAWLLWVKHRREIKKPLTPTQAQTQLEEFSQWGIPRAVAAIKHTVAKGWQGIREPEQSEGHNGKPQRDRSDVGIYQGMIARDDENILFRERDRSALHAGCAGLRVVRASRLAVGGAGLVRYRLHGRCVFPWRCGGLDRTAQVRTTDHFAGSGQTAPAAEASGRSVARVGDSVGPAVHRTGRPHQLLRPTGLRRIPQASRVAGRSRHGQ